VVKDGAECGLSSLDQPGGLGLGFRGWKSGDALTSSDPPRETLPDFRRAIRHWDTRQTVLPVLGARAPQPKVVWDDHAKLDVHVAGHGEGDGLLPLNAAVRDRPPPAGGTDEFLLEALFGGHHAPHLPRRRVSLRRPVLLLFALGLLPHSRGRAERGLLALGVVSGPTPAVACADGTADAAEETDGGQDEEQDEERQDLSQFLSAVVVACSLVHALIRGP